MLTNEQCVKVAEKLWRWKLTRVSGDGDCRCWMEPYPPTKIGAIGIDRLKEEVHSWQGFGRTVEAMAPKWQLAEYYHKDDDVTRIGFVDKQLKFFPVIWDYSEPLEIIEALHLAALEAVNES